MRDILFRIAREMANMLYKGAAGMTVKYVLSAAWDAVKMLLQVTP